MKPRLMSLGLQAVVFAATTSMAMAQTTPAPAAAAPEALVLHFDLGSTAVREQDRAVLDQASRLYRDGHPVVMIVSGSADSVGSPESNLLISQQRAATVLRGLVARGIPAERFQLLAKGETDPVVPARQGIAQAENRRVEIRWR